MLHVIVVVVVLVWSSSRPGVNGSLLSQNGLTAKRTTETVAGKRFPLSLQSVAESTNSSWSWSSSVLPLLLSLSSVDIPPSSLSSPSSSSSPCTSPMESFSAVRVPRESSSLPVPLLQYPHPLKCLRSPRDLRVSTVPSFSFFHGAFTLLLLLPLLLPSCFFSQ